MNKGRSPLDQVRYRLSPTTTPPDYDVECHQIKVPLRTALQRLTSPDDPLLALRDARFSADWLAVIVRQRNRVVFFLIDAPLTPARRSGRC